MRREAHKLTGWRKGAVLDLLQSGLGSKQELEKVFRAAIIRDEHYHTTRLTRTDCVAARSSSWVSSCLPSC